MNDVDSKPINQGWSPAWIAVKFILAVPTLGVVCVALALTMVIAANMTEVCPNGMHVGHAPCDLSIILCPISLLIVGLGIWFLRWIGRLDATWIRVQPWFARKARDWGNQFDRWQWHERLERWRRWQPFARARDAEGERDSEGE